MIKGEPHMALKDDFLAFGFLFFFFFASYFRVVKMCSKASPSFCMHNPVR